jgi:hypothetical protein
MAESGSGTGCTSYYVFTPCCGGIPIRFCRNTPPALQSGATFQYTGPNLIGYGGILETNKCYGVSVVNGSANYPSIAAELIENNFLRATGGCNSALCPDCPTEYYTLNDCCTDLPINWPPNEAGFQGTLYLEFDGSSCTGNLNESPCPEILTPLIIIQILNEAQFNVTGCLKLTSVLVTDIPVGADILSWEQIVQEVEVVETCSDCQTCYYQITNCADENETYCTASNLSAYINNNIENPGAWPTIQVLEKPNKCFYVEQITSCVAPIPITLNPAIPVVVSCAKCQAKIVVYYKLVNCNDPQVYIYTSTELGDYVGSYIKLEEYGNECFYVSVVDGLVPNDIPVTPKEPAFETCEECALPRYLLTDCAGILEDIVTYTDLSANVGEVIVISTCPDTCWSVEETDLVDFDGTVQVVNQYETCSTCLANTIPSTCVTFTNTTSEEENFDVITYQGVVTKYTVGANSTLPKSCLISWNLPVGIVVTEYGNCTNGVCPAPAPQPKRKVTPGYNTPACTPAYYENVECNFSEWMYKDVLEKRYGISSCCVEELMKWEIKHEMLMLDALINPDYVCQPTSSCCNPPTPVGCTSCGCSSCNCNN